MKKRPLLLLLAIPLAVWLSPYVLGYLIVLYNSWPPVSIERYRQRREIQTRVASWDTLKRDCQSLYQQHQGGAFIWRRGDTNPLPATLASLKPKEVFFLSPELLKQSGEGEHPAVICIEVFGMHSTGGHSIPR